MRKDFVLLLCLICLTNSVLLGQTQVTFSKDYADTPLDEVLSDLQVYFNIKIFYKKEWTSSLTVSQSLVETSLTQSLDRVLYQTKLSYQVLRDEIVVILNDGLTQIRPNYSFSGTIKLANTNELVPNASLYFKELDERIISDQNGAFLSSLPRGRYFVVVKSPNTVDKIFTLALTQDTTIQVEVFDKTIELEGVVISGEAVDENVQGTNSGKVTLNVEAIRTLPNFMGEVDISKIITTIPGVSTIGEGATGFNVRGGNIDQNLILLDGIPIYNSSHLLGFFSLFNPDLIGNFTLYKGAIPAQYGGRLSSMLSVNQIIPDKKTFSMKGGIGPVSNRVQADIPIILEKSGAVIGARYANPFLLLNNIDNEDVQRSSASYGDINFKYHHTLSEKNVISVSAYASRDNFSFSADTTYKYGSNGLALQWNHKFNNKLTSNLTGFFSEYTAKLEDRSDTREFDLDNGILNRGINGNLTYYADNGVLLDIGFNTNLYEMRQGTLKPIDGSVLARQELPTEKAIETGIYINSEWELSSNLSANAGLRFSTFSNIGPGEEFLYNPNVAKSDISIIDTLTYEDGEIARTFSGLEPRLSLKLQLDASSSIKASYSLNRQYIHLFSNSTASLPTDIWKASDANVEPQLGHQYSIGYFKNFKSNDYETSAEIFYKDIRSVTELKTGAEVLLNETLTADLLNSTGRAYGLELYFKKQTGRLNGWISYTYSRAERKILSEFREEIVNGGEYFPANFDSPHSLNLTSSFRASRLWTVSWNFVFQSGRPVTVPQSSFTYNGLKHNTNTSGIRVFSFTERNNFRIPDTHRLDISVTLAGSNKRNKNWQNSFTFSLYNVYGRKNPFSVYVRTFDANQNIPRVYKLSVLGAAFPSFTYNFKFMNANKK